MSSKEWEFRIHDILKSLDKIENYVGSFNFNQFKKNELLIDAVVRNLEIIGEASKSIPVSVKRKYAEIPWNQMSSMRNILIHEYFGVDVNIVWHTIKKSLPSLRSQLLHLLAEKNA